MSRFVSDLKYKLKYHLILKNEYIKEKYWEYYAEYPGTGLGDQVKRLNKIMQLNYECRKNNYVEEKGALLTPEELAELLEVYDVISFDVFDTLLLRQVEKPTDVFSFMEAKYSLPRFCHLRMRAEAEARKKSPMGEVDLHDIYELLEKWIGIDKALWMEREIEAEKKLCYANPYMKILIEKLKTKQKRMIAVSDMYLKQDVICDLLTSAGYDGIEEVFVSNEYQMSKGNGKLYDVVKKYVGNKRVIHIGDNIASDYAGAKKQGLDAWHYPNVNARYGIPNLLYGMTRLTGAFTKGILNAYLNNGTNSYTPYFEYGMVNGGLLACGYCEFLNKVVKEKNVDKILFVARDGFIIKKVYDSYYHECDNDYILFSRFCSEQILFEKYAEDYIHHNFYYRLGMEQKTSLEQILKETDLEFLIEKLSDYGLRKEELYTSENNDKVVSLIYGEKERIIEYFKSTQENMYEYLRPMIQGCRKILVVDMGWFGTGGLAIKFLLEEKYGQNIEVLSALVGTNEDASLEGRIAAGKLYPYAYSPVHDLYLLHWHTRHQYNVHNLLIELLFSAPSPSFLKFERSEDGELQPRFSYDEKENYDIIYEMHDGILTFARLYNALDEDIKSMLQINGGDAYAAFMCTADNPSKCYELFKDYKISQLSGIFGSKSITTMGQIMKEDHYI